MIGAILRPTFLTVRNRLRDRRERKRSLLLVFVASLIVLCIYIGFIAILTSVENSLLFETIVPAKLFELIFYAFFILLCISTTAATIGNSYTSPRIELFLSLPLTSASLFFSKLIETLIETGTMYFVFFVPVLLAYVTVFPLPVHFILTGLLLSVPFLLIPAGLSFFTATVFVRISSFIWKRGLFFLILLSIVLYRLLHHMATLVTSVRAAKAGTNAVVRMVSLFDNPNPLWLPSRWASDILSSFLDPSLRTSQICLALLTSTAFAAVALGFLTFDFFHLRVRSSALVQQRSPSRSHDFVRTLIEVTARYLPLNQQYRAIIIKDLTSLIRDRAQALSLLLFLGVATIYVVLFSFMTVMLDMSLLAQQAWYATLATLNVIFSSIILITIMTRLVYPAMSLEGSAFWILSVAPLELRKLVSAKFFCWLPFTMTLVVTLLLSGALAIGLPLQVHLITFVIAVSYAVGFTGLAIGIGSIFASFEWESPSKLSTGFGTLVLMLSTLGLIAVVTPAAATVLSLTIIPRLQEIAGPMLCILLMSGSLFLIIFVNLIVAHWACNKGAESLARDSCDFCHK